MSFASPNEFGDKAENCVLVAGQQYLCSRPDAKVNVATRATRVWAIKEFDLDTKLYRESNGVWLNVNSPNAIKEAGVTGNKDSRPHEEQTHRRTTFEDQCASLYTVSNYGDFTLSLAQLVTILDRMRVAGFIHGDISPVNCLFDTREGHIKISDIEHARQYTSQDEIKAPTIGAPHFMAIEYQRGAHFFGYRMKQGSDCNPSFQFNFLHDLESVIWMYVWLLLNTLPDCLRARDTIARRQTIRECRKTIFAESVEGSYPRILFMKDFCRTYGNMHQYLMRVLELLYGEAGALPMYEGLEASVGHLVACYKEVQSTEPLDGTPTHWDSATFKAEYYAKLHEIFMSVHDGMKDVDYQAISHVKFQQRAKDGLEPPSPAVARTSKLANQERDETPTPSKKRGAEAALEQERHKKPKTGAGPVTRSGKRRAEDEIEKEDVKKIKRAPAPAKPKASAGRKKPAAAAAGPPRRARAKVPVAGTERVLRSQTAAKKNKK